tara:strand:+ start:4621 stop:5850 length:1230 start_codon:yes stop_codon:yes gene_type:complete
MVSQTLASAILNQKGPDLVGSFREGQEFAKGQQVEKLTGQALQAGGGQKLQELIGLDPEVGYSLGEAIGARSAKELNNFIRDASITENFFKQGNFDQGRQFIQQSLDTVKMAGGSGKIQQNLLDILDNQGPQAALDNVQSFTAVLAKSKEQTSGNQDRSRLLADLESDNPEIAKSARIALKLESGAGNLSSAERVALDKLLGKAVTDQKTDESRGAESGKLDAQLAQKPGVESAVTTATSQAEFSADVVKSSFESIGKARKSIGNIDRAIKAIDDGANTGFVQGFFPSITTASVELDQLRNELGLDVIGAVTFGALSKGELDLALNTALPTNLSGPALREFLLDKKEAQKNLVLNMQEAVRFLSKPGATLSDFISLKNPETKGDQPETSDGLKSIDEMTDAELEAELNQ